MALGGAESHCDGCAGGVGAGGAGDLRDDDESPVSVVRRADVPEFAVRAAECLARLAECVALQRGDDALCRFRFASLPGFSFLRRFGVFGFFALLAFFIGLLFLGRLRFAFLAFGVFAGLLFGGFFGGAFRGFYAALGRRSDRVRASSYGQDEQREDADEHDEP
jgi:hypothetical protein